jgi:putative transposase
LYVLFFIEIASRRVHLAGCTSQPNGEWVTQQARQVAWTFAERADPVRFLIRDHDRKFTGGFDAVVDHYNTTASPSPQLGPRTAERPTGDRELDRHALDGCETPRPSRRTAR